VEVQSGNTILRNGVAQLANQEIGVPGLQLFSQSARRRDHPGGRAQRSWHRSGHPKNAMFGSDRFFPHLSITLGSIVLQFFECIARSKFIPSISLAHLVKFSS
jgi:hypothetical protein